MRLPAQKWIVPAIVSLFLSTPVWADEWRCPTSRQIDTIKELKRTSPGLTPAKIALQTRLPEAAVVFAMDLDSRIAVEIREFDNIWGRIRQWENMRLVAYASGSEFEMRGRLPAGETDVGYFDYDQMTSAFGGRLKRDRFGIIYLLSTPGQIGEDHQIVFFDREGRRIFAVFVPRNKNGAIQTQPLRMFQRLKNEYSGRYPVCESRF